MYNNLFKMFSVGQVLDHGSSGSWINTIIKLD